MKAVIIACSMGLAACASSGVKVDPQVAATFVPGKTTYTEVRSRLGEPTTSVTTSNGERILAYAYAEAQPRPETFIPIIGPFVGGIDSKGTTVVFTFDAHGTLKEYAAADYNQGTGTGIISRTQEQR